MPRSGAGERASNSAAEGTLAQFHPPVFCLRVPAPVFAFPLESSRPGLSYSCVALPCVALHCCARCAPTADLVWAARLAQRDDNVTSIHFSRIAPKSRSDCLAPILEKEVLLNETLGEDRVRGAP